VRRCPGKSVYNIYNVNVLCDRKTYIIQKPPYYNCFSLVSFARSRSAECEESSNKSYGAKLYISTGVIHSVCCCCCRRVQNARGGSRGAHHVQRLSSTLRLDAPRAFLIIVVPAIYVHTIYYIQREKRSSCILYTHALSVLYVYIYMRSLYLLPYGKVSWRRER